MCLDYLESIATDLNVAEHRPLAVGEGLVLLCRSQTAQQDPYLQLQLLDHSQPISFEQKGNGAGLEQQVVVQKGGAVMLCGRSDDGGGDGVFVVLICY